MTLSPETVCIRQALDWAVGCLKHQPQLSYPPSPPWGASGSNTVGAAPAKGVLAADEMEFTASPGNALHVSVLFASTP